VLQRFQQALDAQAKEHLKECTWLYYVYATKYDEYITEHYAMSNLSEDDILHKTRKARKSFFAERMGLPPHKRSPEFYQVIDIQDMSHKADALAPPEPVQPGPVTGSTLSVKASVIPTDNQLEVPKTSPPERKTVVKCTRPVSESVLIVPHPT
jgi:hypothetical protein